MDGYKTASVQESVTAKTVTKRDRDTHAGVTRRLFPSRSQRRALTELACTDNVLVRPLYRVYPHCMLISLRVRGALPSMPAGTFLRSGPVDRDIGRRLTSILLYPRYVTTILFAANGVEHAQSFYRTPRQSRKIELWGRAPTTRLDSWESVEAK